MGKLTDIFFTVEPTAEKPKQEKHPAKVEQQVQASVLSKPVDTVASPTPGANAPVQSTGQSNADMVAQLQTFLCEHNLPGPDYLELKANMATLSAHITVEEALVKAAFDMLRMAYPSLTKEDISNSIDKYRNMLETERSNGIKECQEAFNAKDKTPQINAERANLDRYAKEIAAAKEEYDRKMKSLDEAYRQSQANIEAYEAENRAVVEKHNADIATFNASVDEVIAMISADQEKINKITL